MLKLGVALVVLLAVSAGPPAKDRPRQKWLSDVDHSSIEFRTQHWGIVDIIGWFEDFQITVYADEDDFSDAIIEARVGVGSIRMPNSEMARNLTDLFFDLDNYPDATFKSTEIRLVKANEYEVIGQLTMNGVTRDLKWRGTLNGFGNPPNAIPGFTLRAELDRSAFAVGDEQVDKVVPGQPPTVANIVVVTCNVRLDYAN